ncbi:proliferating cell nuclear antigen (pcna) [Candidatus Woesearchaeota archaeon]|nr:proliferating cell nuclear antigen (pcna) [Candidatus Woesearchaeota archaeon]
MKLSLAEPKYFKDSITIISDLVNEARFKVSSESIELVAMDPANVAMVVFKMFSSSFIEYDVKENIELAINLNNLKQILRRTKANDILSLQDDNNKLVVTLKGSSTRKFSLPLIEFEEKEQKVPSLNFPITVQMPADVLTDAIEDADVVGESVSLIMDGDKFNVVSEGDLNKAEIEIKGSDSVKIINEKKGDKIKAKYSIEYLKKMIPASKISGEVTLQFNTDYPLKLEFKEVDKILLDFILAPRVDND